MDTTKIRYFTPEDVYTAIIQFRENNRGVSPNTIRMHPRMWEAFRLHMHSTNHHIFSPPFIDRMWGLPVKEDVSLWLYEVVVSLEAQVAGRDKE